MFWTGFAQVQQLSDFWMKTMKDQVGRFEAFQKEMERYELQGFERAGEAIDEAAKLSRESMGYAQKLGTEWRKISFEALKKSSETFGAAS